MVVEMPRYEVRYNNKAEWEEISEIEVLESMQKGICQGNPSHSGHDSRQTSYDTGCNL